MSGHTTAVNWKAYRVVEIGCGCPDVTLGYFSSRARAEMEMLKHASDPRCKHGGVEIEEIEIES